MSSTELSEDGSGALERALGAEHAAVWVYGLARAFVPESATGSAVEEGASSHREHRDRARTLLRAAGATPPAPRAAYRTPSPVRDRNSAIHALLAVERDCSVGWVAVLERSRSTELSELALRGLTGAARRATKWRIELGERPSVPPFPGRE
ncbi:ferritin-like domain-containing protein [Actinopolyspora mortivallis]|uniref:DUF4439 domain-containing protein n=1 Tax=Actinopolyspora mortivallis TaxID=33906 RepID=A0A2T0GZB7_ACTMO|nr:ferritin-like domain-containing protein [Actinopolyspora mortivallis]PRW64451.1 DUF4439 domain-containing protein [Actinopolyspora mortivallis]